MLKPPANRLLFLAHLAEPGTTRMNATAYRLMARRLRQATAGFPERWLAQEMGARHPQVLEALETRHFDTHGRFASVHMVQAQRQTDALLARIMNAA